MIKQKLLDSHWLSIRSFLSKWLTVIRSNLTYLSVSFNYTLYNLINSYQYRHRHQLLTGYIYNRISFKSGLLQPQIPVYNDLNTMNRTFLSRPSLSHNIFKVIHPTENSHYPQTCYHGL